ncbi:hypothetical protein BpHYR1_008374 [Brachionus plicatilis]|uniref:Uncharacterized protein n=1 Tax=Brachionus plicatilis TaxID=10195 RepID=A0A3M7RS15_BRAPC|nr:hypothetical protein BpHYR1_008374 [Brachionus plicatilis]
MNLLLKKIIRSNKLKPKTGILIKFKIFKSTKKYRKNIIFESFYLKILKYYAMILCLNKN